MIRVTFHAETFLGMIIDLSEVIVKSYSKNKTCIQVTGHKKLIHYVKIKAQIRFMNIYQKMKYRKVKHEVEVVTIKHSVGKYEINSHEWRNIGPFNYFASLSLFSH